MIVLYIDDSKTMQTIAEITLRGSDFEYVGARTIEDGYRLALERQPVLILIDADDAGYALCARLKAERDLAGVLVIMVCGNSQPYDAGRGADGMVSKPWDTQILLDKLTQLVDDGPQPVAVAPPAAPAMARPSAPAPAPPAEAARSQTIMGMPSIKLPPGVAAPAAAAAPEMEKTPSIRLPDPFVEPEKPRYVDDNVQFTVYRPKVMAPEKWHPLLAFAHLAERRDDEEELDPIEEVQRQARQALGDDAARFTDTTQDASASIPAEGELTIVPELAGVTVNPRARTFLWTEPVHREEFRIRAGAALDGQTVRGKVTVWLGSLIVAEVPLAIRVANGASDLDAKPAPAKARPYRKIFASYSHRDGHIVDEVSRLARALGDEYIRDWVHLRTGQVWNDQLRTLIAEADIFQLFWSHNSMRSKYCKEEWEYALSLGRPTFVRPTYWEDPMPADPAADMPPESLVRLHFQKIRVAADWAPPPPVVEAEKRKARKAEAQLSLEELAKLAEERPEPEPLESAKRDDGPAKTMFSRPAPSALDDLPVFSASAGFTPSPSIGGPAEVRPQASRTWIVVLAVALLAIAAAIAWFVLS